MLLFRNSFRIPYLILVACLTGFFGYHCLSLRVDQDNRSMDADNEVQAAVDREFGDLFDEGESILVAVKRDDILNDSGKELIRNIEKDLIEIDGINQVTSLSDNDFLVSKYHEGVLISKDRAIAGISLELREFKDNGESLGGVVEEIRAIATQYSSDEVAVLVTGLPLHKFEAGRMVGRDQKIFSPLAFFILGVVLLCITRHFSGLVLPLAVAAITICWTLGLYSILGHSLNIITSLLPPVMMTLAVTTSIHIYLHWAQNPEGDNEERIVAALRSLYRPCLFASLTTAIGFLSLLMSHTPAVRMFGLFAAIGVLISYIVGVSGLAVGLSFFKERPVFSQNRRGWISRILDKGAALSIDHSGKIIAATVVVTVLGAFGLQKVKSNTDILRFLGSDTRLYRDTMVVDQSLTGVNAIELLVQRSDGMVLSSYEELEMLESFEQSVRKLPHVSHCLGIADLLAEPEALQARNQLSFANLIANFDSDKYISANLKTARITVRSEAIGTHAGAQLIDAIRQAAKSDLGQEYTLREAGSFHRVIAESNHLVTTQIKSFGIAIGLILLSIGIVFRSFEYMALAIIPNVIPLVMTAAIMGFFQIDLSTGTAMIASVVLGVAVDDTIHYLSAYRKSVRHTGDCRLSLRRTTASTGFALVSTTLALSLGFWVAIFGSFQPTVYFALLSGLTMWFALICDLLVLPASLKLFHSRRFNT